jgi:hypothetical protein
VVLRRGKAGVVRNGPWRHNPLAGSTAAGPYGRARLARFAPLALNASEAVYFVAQTDSDGNPFRCEHSYRVEGRPPEGRWWSVTAYAADGFLMPNPADRWSFNSENVQSDADGGFVIHLSRKERSTNWLPLGVGETFLLALRVYNPEPSVRDHPATAELPRIVREGPAGE